MDKEKAHAVVRKARQIAQLMNEICELASSQNPEIGTLICAEFPFAKSLDEVACDVIGWRDAMAEKVGVPL